MEIIQPTQAPPSPGTNRRRWATAVTLLLVLLLLLFASLGTGRAPTAAPPDEATADGPGDESQDVSDRKRIPQPHDAPARARGTAAVELSSGDPDHGDPGPVELDPVGDGDPIDPCAALAPGDGHLLVVPDPVVLPDGEMEGELHLRNCGPAPVAWTAATKPTVALAAAGGALAPGQLTALGFAIDHDAWDPGAIDFKVRVSEPTDNHYVDVHAFRPLVGADVVASQDISAGPHVGGCAEQCISKALLHRALSTPDVSLEVGTTVPAKVRVYVSQQAPTTTPAGDPVFPGHAPRAVSPAAVEAWTASLANLDEGTKYFIIVRATDGDGDTAYRSGSFRTTTPFEPAGGLAPQDLEPGCSNMCITRATVTPGASLAPSAVSVRTHTPAQLELVLSTDAPTYVDGVPTFDHKDVWRASGLDYIDAWDFTVDGLQPATTYHGLVVARDANGHRSFAEGSFTTDGVDLLVTVHEVHVSQDGDDSDLNRGEVSFAWGVGDATAGRRGEEQLRAGAVVRFGRSQSAYVVRDATGTVPIVYITASERDADGLFDFCAEGDGVAHEPGYDAGCDTKRNVASSRTVRIGDLGHEQECSELGIDGTFGDEACMRLVSEDLGDDYPEIWAVVSISIVP